MADEKKEKIVITGVGVVSSIGIGKEAFWQGLKEGRSGIKPVTLFDTSTTRSKLAGEISDFKPEEILGPKGLRNLDRTTLLALCAAKLALEDARFEITDENADDVGVVLGSTMGSVWSISEFDKESLRNGFKSVNPALFQNTVINSPASQVSIRFNIRGFNTTISSGFNSSMDALEYAARFLELGRAKAVLVGGVEELCEQIYKGFHKIGFLSASRNGTEELCAPFDLRRNGAVLGEGSALFLLETEACAQKRGAAIYARWDGIVSVFDEKNYFKYGRGGGGLTRTIEKVLEDSEITPRDIDCVAASANSTVDGDYLESRVLRKTIVDRHQDVVASAIKSMIGETFSGSGAFQIASSLFMLTDKRIYPTINLLSQDPRCKINCSSRSFSNVKIKRVLVPSLSPMGQCSAAVLVRDKK